MRASFAEGAGGATATAGTAAGACEPLPAGAAEPPVAGAALAGAAFFAEAARVDVEGAMVTRGRRRRRFGGGGEQRAAIWERRRAFKACQMKDDMIRTNLQQGEGDAVYIVI